MAAENLALILSIFMQPGPGVLMGTGEFTAGGNPVMD